MPRSQNAHAIVNAGFLYEICNDRIQKARLVFGGLSPRFVHATRTEYFLSKKNIFNNFTLKRALQILESELFVENKPPQFSARYRKKLALGLFYKVLL